jgi:predicted nuclease of predicted toxin-antitoxin system
MHLLTDQDVYQVTVDQLKKWGHDVITAKEFGMQRASGESLLRKAKETSRIFVTRDKDFGALVFLEEVLSAGVILLRITPLMVEDVHQELHQVFCKYTENELKTLFCVVEPYRYRIRHLQVT